MGSLSEISRDDGGGQRSRDEVASDAVADAFTAYAVAIYQFAYRRLGNRADAEDVTSQVFFKASRAFDATYSEPQRRAWLFRAARTAIVDIWRSYGGGSVIPLDWYVESPAPVKAVDDRASIRVEKILAMLNPAQRRVLELRFLEGRSLLEAAAELGYTEANVKVIQHRALRRAAALEAGAPHG